MTKTLPVLTEQELKLAAELGERLRNQDTLGTATPVWFVVQDRERFLDPIEDTGKKIYFDGDTEFEGEDEDDIILQVIESEDLSEEALEARKEYVRGDNTRDEDERVLAIENLEADFEERREQITSDVEDNCYNVDYRWENKETFFTREAAEQHIRENHYHYSSEARVYIEHAWRNTEAELVRKILTTY